MVVYELLASAYHLNWPFRRYPRGDMTRGNEYSYTALFQRKKVKKINEAFI